MNTKISQQGLHRCGVGGGDSRSMTGDGDDGGDRRRRGMTEEALGGAHRVGVYVHEPTGGA
jgi:hypothetical protein